MAQTDFEKAISKFDGWQVVHQQDAKVRQAAGTKGATQQIVVDLGHYIAMRRHDNGVSTIEFAGETPEEVAGYIEQWEADQATGVTGGPDTLIPEMVEESARATRLAQVSASARGIVEDPDANEAARTQRDEAPSQAKIAGKAAKAAKSAVDTVTSEVTKAGGSDAQAKDAAETARSAVERAVASQTP